jgi:hypothetical protein
MQRKTLLALAIAVIVSSALLYLSLQPEAPSQPAPQPAQPAVSAAQPQQAQNATQAQTQPQSKPPTIIAVIETSQGGRVLANGTETAVWSSTKPFALLLKAVPDTCYAFDHWEVNGTEHSGTDLALAITGNTTIRAVFYKPLYTVTVNANATGAAAQINGENHTLPTSLRVPACSTLEVKPLETPLYKPLNNTLTVTVRDSVAITLYYWQKSRYPFQVFINGKPQYVEVRESPFIKSNGTVEIQGDWIHMRGNIFIYVYIPWNLTNVIIEGKLISGNITIWRFCEWGASPVAYGTSITKWTTVARFTGCRPNRPYPNMFLGPRSDYQLPGALLIDLVNGEAWLKIEAYP